MFTFQLFYDYSSINSIAISPNSEYIATALKPEHSAYEAYETNNSSPP